MLTVKLSDYSKPTIDLRETISRVTQDIVCSKADKVFLDFSNLVFISRAAADQLLKEKKLLNDRNIEVVFLNLASNILEMLNRVSKNTTQKNASELPILEIDQPQKIISVLSRLFHRTA